jgi:ankyrin repeat protein
VEKGANVNAKGKNGYTPLYFAVRSSNAELVKYLVEKGADIDARNNQYITPLIIAIVMPSSTSDIAKYLIDKYLLEKGDEKDDILRLAVRNSNFEVVKYIVEKGANVNSKDSKDYFGNTLLHLASGSASNLEMVKYLVEKGADTNAKNRKNKTPLELAQEECSNCKDVIDFLTENSTSHDVENTAEHPESHLEDVSISSSNTRGL